MAKDAVEGAAGPCPGRLSQRRVPRPAAVLTPAITIPELFVGQSELLTEPLLLPVPFSSDFSMGGQKPGSCLRQDNFAV